MSGRLTSTDYLVNRYEITKRPIISLEKPRGLLLLNCLFIRLFTSSQSHKVQGLGVLRGAVSMPNHLENLKLKCTKL